MDFALGVRCFAGKGRCGKEELDKMTGEQASKREWIAYEAVKERLAFRLIPQRGNERLLEIAAHIRFLDLAILFYFTLEAEDRRYAMITIGREQMVSDSKKKLPPEYAAGVWPALGANCENDRFQGGSRGHLADLHFEQCRLILRSGLYTL